MRVPPSKSPTTVSCAGGVSRKGFLRFAKHTSHACCAVRHRTHRARMAARALARLPRLSPGVSNRCSLPLVGQIGAASNHRRPGESREDDRYARAQRLVAQTRDIHVTRRNESTVLLAGVGIAASAMLARYGLLEYRRYKVSFDGYAALIIDRELRYVCGSFVRVY